MTPAAILQHLTAAGLTIRTDGNMVLASPVACLTDATRSMIRANKDALLAHLTARFFGWWRPARGRWRPVVDGVTYDEAMGRLVAYQPAGV